MHITMVDTNKHVYLFNNVSYLIMKNTFSYNDAKLHVIKVIIDSRLLFLGSRNTGNVKLGGKKADYKLFFKQHMLSIITSAHWRPAQLITVTASLAMTHSRLC